MSIKKLLSAFAALLALAACQKEVDYSMTLSTKQLTVSSDGGTFTFDVTSNDYYRVNNDCDFAKIIDTQTVGEVTTFTLKVYENVEQEPRSSQIRFISDHTTPLKLKVDQKAFVPYGVSVSEIMVEADATEASFTVLGEKAWTASVDNSKFKLSSTSGEGESTVKVTFPASTSEDSEVAVVKVVINGETFTVTITQKSKYYTGVDPQEISVGYAATSASFSISTQKAWTASSDNAAFKLSATSGTGNATVTVSFPENDDETAKSATVTVKVADKTFSVKITQAAAPKKEYKDLSANATSNCYIVSETGYYSFKATVRGNGAVPASQTISANISPASVKLLWSSYGTSEKPASDDAIISKLELKDGNVRFGAGLNGFRNGNAVIAACDASGAIVWSWHIWLTEAPKDLTVGSDTWMDRNLGAVGENTKNNPKAFGLHYQWGRKDPFRCATDFVDDVDNTKLIETTGTWPDPELTVEANAGVENTIARPQVFLYAQDAKYNNKDWNWGVKYDDLWGAGDATVTVTSKTMFDPCPVGYCVPTSQQHKDMATATAITKADIDKDNHGIGNDSFWLCYPSGPVYDSGRFNEGSCQKVGSYSWYGTSSVKDINMLCTRSHTTAVNFGGATSARCAGYSIRCVKQ